MKSRTGRTLFLLCWCAYFSSYLGRLNYPSVMPEIVGTGILSMSQAGLLNTAFFVFYAVGQLTNGILSDRFPPSRMVSIGLLATAIANLLFGLSASFPAMLILRSVIGYPSYYNKVTATQSSTKGTMSAM